MPAKPVSAANVLHSAWHREHGSRAHMPLAMPRLDTATVKSRTRQPGCGAISELAITELSVDVIAPALDRAASESGARVTRAGTDLGCGRDATYLDRHWAEVILGAVTPRDGMAMRPTSVAKLSV